MSTVSTPGDPREPKPASNPVRLIVTPEPSDSVRRTMVGLWLAGAAIAGAIVPLATTRQSPSSGTLSVDGESTVRLHGVGRALVGVP
jgi:hypothetical protein